ncbi:helix-turn-helix domain-containing protein [Hyalangium minutum]|uniref:AlbA family DNA-binding domain-containing protein n=1 Tax=Hyalangium minutum TaxID=394096 RepID=UPI00094B42F0|nr:ATP-binding protein [Hyalangium minutum]
MENPARTIFNSINTDQDVGRLIRTQVEDLYVDFKTKQDHAISDVDQHLQAVLSKAIAGFANADGGVIVLGVNAPQGQPPSLKLIAPLNDFEQEVNSYIPRSTSFPVAGAETKKVPFQGQAGGVVLVYVPKSDLAPHCSMKDRRYYQRIGDSFLPMEHYQIADMFGRRHQPRLVPYVEASRDINSRGGMELIVGVKNVGVAIARYVYLSVEERAQFSFSDYGISGNGHWGLPPFVGGSRLSEYRGGVDHVIHPGVALPVTKMRGAVRVDTPATLLEEYSQITIAGRVVAEGAVLKNWRVFLSRAQIQQILSGPNQSVVLDSILT